MGIIVGVVLAVFSSVCNGSFAALRQLESVAKIGASDIEFNWYLSGGVFLSSVGTMLLVPFTQHTIGLCWEGIIAGGLLAIAGLTSFIAVSYTGLSLAQGTWGGTSIIGIPFQLHFLFNLFLVSFLWGVIGPENIRGTVSSPQLCLVALTLILSGVAGIIKSFHGTENEKAEISIRGKNDGFPYD